MRRSGGSTQLFLTICVWCYLTLKGVHSQTTCTQSESRTGTLEKDLRLHCEPSPGTSCSNLDDVIWKVLRGGSTQPLDSLSSHTEIDNGDLVVGVDGDVGGTVFICRCSESSQESSCYTVLVDVVITTFSATPSVTREGDSVRLDCKATAYPQPTISDYRIFRFLPESGSNLPLQMDANGTVFATIDSANVDDDSGTYECTVNIQWDGIGLHGTESTEVKVYRPPRVAAGLNSTVCGTGTAMQPTATLECTVEEGSSDAVRIEWTRNGIALTNGVTHVMYSIIENGNRVEMLIVRKVNESDEGEYECVVYTPYSESPEDKMTLKISSVTADTKDPTSTDYKMAFIIVVIVMCIVLFLVVAVFIIALYRRGQKRSRHHIESGSPSTNGVYPHTESSNRLTTSCFSERSDDTGTESPTASQRTDHESLRMTESPASPPDEPLATTADNRSLTLTAEIHPSPTDVEEHHSSETNQRTPPQSQPRSPSISQQPQSLPPTYSQVQRSDQDTQPRMLPSPSSSSSSASSPSSSPFLLLPSPSPLPASSSALLGRLGSRRRAHSESTPQSRAITRIGKRRDSTRSTVSSAGAGEAAGLLSLNETDSRSSKGQHNI